MPLELSAGGGWGGGGFFTLLPFGWVTQAIGERWSIMPGGMPGIMPGGMPGRMPAIMPGGMPGIMPGGMDIPCGSLPICI